VGAAFLLLGALVWWGGRPLVGQVLGGVGTALIIFGVLLPGVLSPVHHVWMAMAVAISKVTTPIFLGAVYFGIIMPIGLARRLFGYNAVKSKPEGDSFWVDRNSGRDHTGMEHQF
jgi:hypothetical protein